MSDFAMSVLQNLPAVIMLIIGFALVVVEMYIPGFGAPGIIGIILLVAGVISTNPTPLQALVLALIIVVLLCIAFTICIRTVSKGRFSKTPLVLNDVSVFTMDVYDIVDINTLAIGDTVVVEGKPIEVESIEQDGDHLIVNGGMDEENGVEFVSHEEDNCYRVLLYDDHTTYTNHGSASLVISPDAVYTDSSNLEEDPLVFSYDDIPSALASSDNDMFIELNTTVRMEAGKIAEITRVYIP